MNLEARSVNIFSYYIPVNTSNYPTTAATFQLYSYTLNTPIEVYIATSVDFSVVDEKVPDMAIEGGRAIMFTNDD